MLTVPCAGSVDPLYVRLASVSASVPNNPALPLSSSDELLKVPPSATVNLSSLATGKSLTASMLIVTVV